MKWRDDCEKKFDMPIVIMPLIEWLMNRLDKLEKKNEQLLAIIKDMSKEKE